MNVQRVTAVVLFAVVACTSGLRAQPEPDLRAALERLFHAGNYSWRESRQQTLNGRAHVTPYGFGRTLIDGFTIATIIEPHNQRAVFHGPRTAFQTKEGWRRAEDLTEAEIAEVFGLNPKFVSPSTIKYRRQYRHAMLHDCLRLLVRAMTNIREEDGAFVGEVPSIDLEMFLSSGRAPAERSAPSILGVSLPMPRPTRNRPGQTSVFQAWLVDGQLAKIVFDFGRTHVGRTGASAGKEMTLQDVYIFDLMEIGKTQVDIGPEIMGVFNDLPSRR